MMPPTLPRKRRVPQPLRGYRGPLVSAFGRAYRAFVGQYGWPPSGSRWEAAQERAALAEGRLELARRAWAPLSERVRHTKKSLARATAAEKAMTRADEALSRALADLRAALPPPPPPMSKQEEAKKQMAEYRASLRAGAVASEPSPRPISSDVGTRAASEAKTAEPGAASA